MTNMNRGQWTTKDDERLLEEWAKGTSTKNIATLLGRTQGSVYTRLSNLRKSGVDVERRGESTGPVKPSRKGGPKNVLPTGEDVKPKVKSSLDAEKGRENPTKQKVELTQFMVEKTNEEFNEMKTVIKTIQSDNASLRQRLAQLQRTEAGDMHRLERENAVLRAALIASNNVIAVYMAQDEVEE